MIDAPELLVPPWAWLAFAGLVLALIFVDLFAHRGTRESDRRSAIVWSAVWVGAALAFNGGIWAAFGRDAAEEFFAAYILEKSLSVDNLFVFLVVFQTLRIPADQERRVLSWGIFGAIVLRALFIAIGAALLERWHAVVYVFGALLVFTAFRLLRPPKDEGHGGLLAWVQRHVPFTPSTQGFVVRRAGRPVATSLLVALIVIELTDVVFAVDSIPAAFAVTDHPFLVYTSNIFALLGLRSLYVVLAEGLRTLRYLRFGLAAVLAFAGVKMMGSAFFHVSPLASIAVIVFVLGVAVTVSLLRGVPTPPPPLRGKRGGSPEIPKMEEERTRGEVSVEPG